MIYYKDFEKSLGVCSDCGTHMRLPSGTRIKFLLDDGKYEKIKVPLSKIDPLSFKDKKRYLLDSSSNLISIEKDEIFEGLPNIFGEEAEKHFVSFLNKLKNNNFPIKQINKFYYFKIERWDLELINNKTIKFPYNISGDVIKKSIELLNDNDFKNYNTIDLRMDGKIIVE